MNLPDWARAHGGPLFDARIRERVEDFRVTEHLGFDPDGVGEHDFLEVEKSGANTEWVARQLARFAHVPVRDVGYAGLKDRHAVTSQWFSVPRRHAPDWRALVIDGVEVLTVRQHSRKLRRGAHRANGFRIVLRGDGFEARRDAITGRIETIRNRGVPNYFGEQRFGRDGGNLALADAWADDRRLPRHKRGLAISTARSYLFNVLLDARVRDGTWDRVIAGDVVNLEGSGSIFTVDVPDATIERRCAEFDVHPTAVLWGEETEGAPPSHPHWVDALRRARVREAHRPLRLGVRELSASIGDDAITLEFMLPRGAFATAVLRELARFEQSVQSGRLEPRATPGAA